MTKKKLRVFDFDGTITDAEREGMEPGLKSPDGLSFVDGYLKDVATICGIPRHEAMERNAQLVAEMREDPTRYCFEIGGEKVAPSSVDPYLRTGMAVKLIMNELGVMIYPPATLAARDRMIVNVLYRYNYLRTSTHFRPGASKLFADLEGEDVCIVSNSDTDGVSRKLDQLPGAVWLDHTNVIGDAKKFVNFANWEGVVAPHLEIPGLNRPVLLRRKYYFDVLNMLRNRYDVAWEDIVVVGDIFELDLALPMALGCTVGLLQNEFTPAYEVAFLRQQGNAHVLTDVSQIADL